MPIVVNDRERRARISEVATLLIDRLGLGGLTIRAIAQEAGCSTSFVTDFFPDKRSMLLHVLGDAARRTKVRIEAVLAADPQDLHGCVLAYLPLDAERRRDWKIYFAFWDMASTDAAFAQEQQRWQRIARHHFESILHRRGLRAMPEEALHGADRLLSLVMGISTQAAFDPETWSPGAMQAFMLREVDALLASAVPLPTPASEARA
jgi:AcrR family transcriptional regulator